MAKEYSLRKLKTYRGTGDRPQDFEHFWNQRIEMLDKVELNVFITNVLDTEFEHFDVYALTFMSFDGARIHAKYIRPKTSEPVPCVLQFHGYPGSSRPYFEHASFLDAGMAVIALDCRGQGGFSQDMGGIQGTTVSGHLVAGLDDCLENMLYVKIYSDVYLVSRIAMQLVDIDESRIYANGASQGAALATVCAALNPSIKKVSLLYPFLSDFERVFDLGYDQVAYEGLRYYSRWFDPDGSNQHKMFERLTYIDVRHFASRIQCEVLFGISMADTVCPISTQYAVYNNLKSKKKLVCYPGKSHEPIYAFDDLILPFFDERDSDVGSVEHQKGFSFQHIKRENKYLIVQIQAEGMYGTHYLRRYLALGYDVLLIKMEGVSYSSRIIDSISRLINKLSNETYQSITIFAEDKQANIAVAIAQTNHSINALVLQTPVGLSLRTIKQSNQILATVLMGLGGLDEAKNIKLNQYFFSSVLSTKQLFDYPKYGRERINAFEDQKLIFLELEKAKYECKK